MKQVIIMPGGFHPFHAGHYALYKQAQDAFPGADVYVAATNDTSTRPFPFALKEKLAKLAGVAPGHFVQVKSPFQAREITANLDPDNTQLIFVRSEKDANKPPQAGGIKKDGTPAYLQLLKGQAELAPMSRHAYMAYLPTVEFGPGMTSATEIRTAWPKLNEKRKTALVMSLYPKTQTNPRLAATVVKMLDTAMGTELDEGMFGLGGPAVGAPLASKNEYNRLGGASKLRHDAHVALKMVDSLKHTNRDGYYDEEIKKYLRQAQEYLAKAKEIEGQQGVAEAEGITRRGVLKGIGAAAAAGTAGKAGAIAGAFPTPSAQQAMYKAAADSNRAEAKRQAELQKQADADRLRKNTELVDKEQRVNHHKLDEFADDDSPIFAQYWDEYEGDLDSIIAEVDPSELQIILDELEAAAEDQGVAEGQLNEFAPDDKDYIEEKWSQKYKRSINCANPKGFSQRAHCAGRKK